MTEPAPVHDAQSENVLDDDFITVPGQLYALVSFVAPTGTNQRNDKFGMKLRGCFASKEEAQGHVKRLQMIDKITDIYLVDMYKWLLIPPDPNALDDHEFQEDFLNKLIKGYRESQELAKQHFMERKEAVKKDGLDAHLLEHERVLPPGTDGAGTSTDAILADASAAGSGAAGSGAADTGAVDTGAVDTAMFEATDPLMARKAAHDA